MKSSPYAAAMRPAAVEVAPESVTKGAARGSSAYRRISLALFLAGFATFSLLYCVQPLLPYFAAEFKIGAAGSSLALSLSTGLLAIAILVAGALSERLGRRGLMFASMVLAAIFNVMAARAPDWHSLLVARAVEGFVLGGVPAVAMAYLAEEISANGLGFSMGLYVGGTAFGGMAGRVGVSYLTDYFSWRSALSTVGILDLFVAVGFVVLLPKSRNFVRNTALGGWDHFALWRKHLKHSLLPAVFAIGCLAMGVFVTVYNYAGFRLMAPPFNLSASKTGLIFSAYIFGIVASSWAGSLGDKLGRGPVLASGIFIAAIGLLATLQSSLFWVTVGIVLVTIGFFTAHSVASGWVGRLADGAKGHASSLYLLGYYLGSSFIGSVGGFFWQRSGWGAVVVFSIGLLAICLVLATILWRKSPGMAR
ncbi:MFS transporter [Paraburkholderia silvatlantica]|uniref:YNFM family putative membrane transporter n=1 Tax=Paraburkholderia silvatlantica TaxID=321895 RepID=A0ABR6FUZ3_9BURK|nr:MFS transporter [Paraburkholderia silvatlantica]MBB2931254.1 YNFM family putative membrane transporter [Paraburkholderia silvatlantica]PVY28305.1 YNFM family putative membrane transporter [Paraburkholderia silvatlantica]PXW34990.1 YNFM family putative membrane transporter [Paraburkholderia silvatlantica]TDQ98897.1 YNFM family putative membrane transporter [Paraburkholderia silvatlantica]